MSRSPLSRLPRLTPDQARASAPDGHVWLSASAGSGKTQVLAARVFRLLLRGVAPEAILCLTFTKAGAAEMAARVSQRLANWVRLPEPDLKKDLFALGEDHNDPQTIGLARTLFAKLLDSPDGGIRIQTIHSFCQSLLAGFPLEAGLVPGFRPMEAREESLLQRETLAALLVAAEREGRSSTIETIGRLSVRLGEGGAEAFLHECARSSAALEALPAGEGVRPFIRRALDLPEGDITEELARCCSDEHFDCASLREIGRLNGGWSAARGQERADVVARWLAASSDERVRSLRDLHAVWATEKGTLRSFGKGQAPTDPTYAELATRLHGRCAELLALAGRAPYAALLADALIVGRDYAHAYAAAKRRVGAVDFDDLIRATVALLEQPGIGEWVRYKLDRTTDHILIDEAQDTNQQQWRIVDALAEEFFTGEGARGRRQRTLFTVGDYKQAIFGFQGTDPLYFAWAERHFQRKAETPSELEVKPTPFSRLSLTSSFRSTRPVLEFVDAAVAEIPEPGLGAIDEIEAHVSEVPGPGSVTLWPPINEGGSGEDEEAWIDDATRELARNIAKAVRRWTIDEPLMLESKGRPLRPEDVMVLVKRRGELAQLIVARLYAEGVPVAGVDRLRLNAPLAAQDLLAAIRFVLQPGDDLSLASLLVSPLIGWSQEELLAAAVPREAGLWSHLRDTQSVERLAPLAAMLRRADLMTPYQFLEALLSGPDGTRRAMLRRLGQEARDPIEELLTAALDYESRATPSLQGFLDWFDRGEVEIVRDPSQPLDAVRVMTAHGAKGLQAPLVILADATVDPDQSPRSLLRWDVAECGDPLPLLRPRSEERSGPVAEWLAEVEERERCEHWRLFYVAATRAEERLVVAGALGSRTKGVPTANSWYAAAARALTRLGVPEGDGERVFAGTVPQAPVRPRARAATASSSPAPLPDWANRVAPEEARPPRPLAPSSLGGDDVADPPPTPAMRDAARRGQLIHELLQRLPDTPHAERFDMAGRWLAQRDGDLALDDRRALIEQALAVLDDPALVPLFGAESLAEAPITAVIGEGLVVSGTVDRLLVTDRAIRVADYKTGRNVPASEAEIPIYHLRQMAAYAAALAVIFPGRAIEASLIYTAGPRVFTLSPETLARHKPSLSGMDQSLGSAA